MADKVYKLSLPDGSGGWEDIDVKLIDNGDDTYSLAVEGSLSIDAGDVNIGNVDVASIAAGDNNIGNVDIASALPAGTNLIGKTGIDQDTSGANVVVAKGQGLNYKATLTVTNGAYTINDVVGGAISLTGLTIGKRYVFHTIALGGVAALAYHLWFFETDIGTPALDNAASTMVAADIAKCLGVIPIAAADYDAGVSAFNVATLKSVGFEFVPTATSIVVYMLADATTTPGTTTLTLRLNGEQID